MSQAEKSIDLLAPKKSLIDLSDPTQGFDSTLMGYSLSTLMEDVILVTLTLTKTVQLFYEMVL